MAKGPPQNKSFVLGADPSPLPALRTRQIQQSILLVRALAAGRLGAHNRSTCSVAGPKKRILALPLSLLLLAFSGPEFQGCNDNAEDLPPEGLPLPPAEDACSTDADCIMDDCMDYRCVAGECAMVASFRDADGDRMSPPPCGMDCNDRNPAVSLGAPEMCDLEDNDCDGVVDEGAPPANESLFVDTSTASTRSIVLPWEETFLVVETTNAALFGRPMSIRGLLEDPIELLRLAEGSRFEAVAGAARTDGRLLIVALTDLGAVRYAIVERAVDVARIVESGSAMAPGAVTDLTVLPHLDQWAIVFATADRGMSGRAVSLGPTVAPIVEVPVPEDLVDVVAASDGVHVVIATSRSELAFFDSMGLEVTRHTTPELALLALGRPVASATGSVVAAIADAFDYNLVRVTSVNGFEPTEVAAPTGNDTDQIHLFGGRELLVVARLGVDQVRVQAVTNEDLSMTAGARLIIEPTLGSFSQVSGAESSRAIAVLASEGTNGSGVAILAGCR